jgi:hypothetical protein
MVKMIAALLLASAGIAIISGGGVITLGIGVFLLVNAFLVLGAVVWA